MVDAQPAAVIVLAAGAGTRMRSATPKVLHPIAGRSLLGHVVHAASGLAPRHLIVVVGHEHERVTAHLNSVIAPQLEPAVAAALGTSYQREQRGTGDAVSTALNHLDLRDLDVGDAVLVLNGDTPLLSTQTLLELLTEHRRNDAAATVGTSVVPDATGLGRILRDDRGELVGIVEQRDATVEQLALDEINTGVFAFDVAALRKTLPQLTSENDQRQEYLTDVIGLLRAGAQPDDAGHPHTVRAHRIADYRQTLGCNDRAELAVLRALLRDELTARWMRYGVTMIDPSSVWLDVTAQLEPDAVIAPNVQLYGSTYVGPGAQVGPDTTLIDTRVGADTTVVRSHAESAQVGSGCSIGPFAYLRPGAVLGVGVKVGAYVEVKNSQLGDDVKVPHLTYVGDATVGEGSNIGAGSVVVNYDGVAKHRTTIGRHCRTGSNTLFIAPVSIGDGAYTAAGSVITSDVPPGALAVARGVQRNIASWVFRRRAGSAAAMAAQQAEQTGETGTPGGTAP